MGMYTHCRGWIELEYGITKEQIDKFFEKAKNNSERADCVICSVIFNCGFNGVPYLFIGGELKNYDKDWEKFIDLVKSDLPWEEMKIEMRYEEADDWTEVHKIK